MDFDRICAALSLGERTAPATPLHGGFIHRMFRVRTARGDYAVKLLNPEIMRRPDALGNYRAAEEGEALLEGAGLPILPAKTIAGRKLHCVDGQYLYVFDYFAGRALTGGEITPAHCAEIGAVLAKIHGVASRAASAPQDAPPIGWSRLAEDLLNVPGARAEGLLLQSAVPMLARITADAEEAGRRLPPVEALCHNDMDPKNVLWRGADFRIIDLECVGFANPLQEMIDLAAAWSGGEEVRFRAFASAYRDAGGEAVTDAATLYDSRRNDLDWLAYNAGRALAKEPQERETARQQIRLTVEKIRSDLRSRERILSWLAALSAP